MWKLWCYYCASLLAIFNPGGDEGLWRSGYVGIHPIFIEECTNCADCSSLLTLFCFINPVREEREDNVRIILIIVWLHLWLWFALCQFGFFSSLSASFHRSLHVDISTVTYKMFNTISLSFIPKCPKAAENGACVYFLLWQNVWENFLSQSVVVFVILRHVFLP